MSGFLANIFNPKPAGAPIPNNGGQGGGNGNTPANGNTPNNNPGNTNNGNQGTQQTPNPNDPGAQANQNPLDAYSKLWDTTNTETDTPPSFSIDPKVMKGVSDAQDFFKGIDPALMQKAQQGDSQAFMDLMQQGMRNVYSTVIEHNGMLTDKFVGARLSHEGKGFDSKVKNHLTTSELAKTDNFNHPAVKQQLIDTAKRIQAQNPDMPAEQVAKEARNYITELANAINPKAKPAESESNQETDWAKWFDAEKDKV
jgi:hypothetical protein